MNIKLSTECKDYLDSSIKATRGKMNPYQTKRHEIYKEMKSNPMKAILYTKYPHAGLAKLVQVIIKGISNES